MTKIAKYLAAATPLSSLYSRLIDSGLVAGLLACWVGGLVGVWMGGCLGVWVSGWVGVWVAGWISLLKDQLSPPEVWLELVMILATLEDPLYAVDTSLRKLLSILDICLFSDEI